MTGFQVLQLRKKSAYQPNGIACNPHKVQLGSQEGTVTTNHACRSYHSSPVSRKALLWDVGYSSGGYYSGAFFGWYLLWEGCASLHQVRNTVRCGTVQHGASPKKECNSVVDKWSSEKEKNKVTYNCSQKAITCWFFSWRCFQFDVSHIGYLGQGSLTWGG